MRLLLLVTLVSSVLSQETTIEPVETTIEPLVTTVEPLVTTVESVETTGVEELTTTEKESTTGEIETRTSKEQNGYGDEAVTPPTHVATTGKANGEKDSRVVPAKVANRHALFFSGYDKDRTARARRAAAAAQNGYGDEPITPPANPYGGGGDDYEEGTTTQATTTTTLTPTTTKAQNGYGDEGITPSISDSPYAPQSEQEYAPVDPYAPPTPAVTDGGYKRIRRHIQNGYGDEAVTPADDGYGSAVTDGGQDEYAPATVPKAPGYGEEAVQHSGYNRR
ncbi:hypothetical protein PENTCL1PPCAC_17482 [Pristionchus entomophagus]|uniref:Uncharacterized protein n=1 Tax=Pristionchus entomophagus TaxID=358040 RepID=A0AAV5TLR1_9BILA|nr:hypothetical protein PENTCL1PPCAC_17482 [Pristionchus entomophagus]